MVADDIVFWFSVAVIAFVALWAIIMIRAYNKVSRNE